jgi:hypothetical protein
MPSARDDVGTAFQTLERPWSLVVGRAIRARETDALQKIFTNVH